MTTTGGNITLDSDDDDDDDDLHRFRGGYIIGGGGGGNDGGGGGMGGNNGGDVLSLPEEEEERATVGQCRTLRLMRMGELGSLCDIVVTVQGREFKCHRAVLAAASPVFKSNLTGREKLGLVLGHADAEAFRICLDYVYGNVGVMDGLDEEVAQDVLKCAVSYAMLDPLKEVQEFIAGNIQVANVFSYFKYATEYKLDLMYVKCRSVIKMHFEEVVRRDDFLRQKYDVVKRLLALNDLKIRGEEVVFSAVVRWIRAKPERKERYAHRLLNLVRFPTLSDAMLVKVSRSATFKSDPYFHKLLLEAFVRRADICANHPDRHRCGPGRDKDWGGGEGVEGADEVSFLCFDKLTRFNGTFPLRLYKSMRFRRRSTRAMTFTVIVKKWKSRTERYQSETRSFMDHRWSVWVDPNYEQKKTEDREAGTYVSLFLCCLSEMDSRKRVDVHVHFALFIASAAKPYGMQKKICAKQQFNSNGQAIGFRRHTKRDVVMDPRSGLYDAKRDELVVGVTLSLPEEAIARELSKVESSEHILRSDDDPGYEQEPYSVMHPHPRSDRPDE